MKKTAVAHANIALIKYWGKRDERLNLPAVGSISVTLEALSTRTTVRFHPEFSEDVLFLNGQPASSEENRRVSQFLNLVRQIAGKNLFARVGSANNFPTEAGLASSASAFAALALAATEAIGFRVGKKALSVLARRGSGSAARSVFGGFVEMYRGEKADGSDSFAEPLTSAEHWPLKVLIAITSEARKPVGSTRGMRRSAETSPYFSAWVRSSDADLAEARQAILDRDFERLADVSEHSCLKMHALMLSSRPPLLYWNQATLEAIHVVRGLRAEGVPVFFTIDAGPQVKAVCEVAALKKVKEKLRTIPGVQRVMESGLGPGAYLLEEKT